MSKRVGLILTTIFVMFAFSVAPVMAQTCAEADVMKAVNDAVAILEAKGEAGLAEVSAMKFCGDNYVFVNDMGGKTLAHAMPHLIGKVLIELKDDTGKRFFAEFAQIALSDKGEGWSEYRWTKPGEDKAKFFPKKSFIKKAKMGDQAVYAGAGVYLQ